ncbi:MAG: hypothetical protein PHU80_05540 [Kiritimatiellae bacterium]|nr:hypothetical protein [Kiritimatiellia bacterium]
MKRSAKCLVVPCLLALAGCSTIRGERPAGPVPCVYRFKMLSRLEDQARVESAIRSVAVGKVDKSGTPAYPEYRFNVAKMADLDKLHPALIYRHNKAWLKLGPQQVLNMRAAGVEAVFDSTDVSAAAKTVITFNVKPGSRLYYKHPGGEETDITARVDKSGKASFTVAIKEGQKYVHARAVKDNVMRYIRVNIFTNEITDIPVRSY